MLETQFILVGAETIAYGGRPECSLVDRRIMIGKIIFAVASLFFGVSLFTTTVAFGESGGMSGVQAFFSAIKHGTAGLFSPESVSDFVSCFLVLMAAAANFIFIFWAMLVFSPTKVTSLKWFWWVSTLFIVAAGYIGVLIALDDRAMLMPGYYLWMGSLLLMLLAPVVSRLERLRAVIHARQSKPKKSKANKSKATLGESGQSQLMAK